MENNKDQEVTPSPNIDFSAFAYYGFAWKKLWKYFLELLLVTIVSFIVELPTIGFNNNSPELFTENFISIDLIFISFEGFGAFILFVVAMYFLFILPLEFGISYIYLKAVRDDKFQVKDMFKVFDNYWNAVFANILVNTIIGFGIVLLVVPGIIFACRLSFVSYLIVDKKMEAVEAVKESWRLTRGHTFNIFIVGLLAAVVIFAGLLSFVVGIVVSIIWIRLAFAAIYFNVSEKMKYQSIIPD